MKILGTGLNGLVGSRVVELLSSKYEFENLSRSTGVDISHAEQILTAVKNSNSDIILHLAAKTNVDGCELDKDAGENGEAWKINVEGTKNVVDACVQSGKKLIYVSTDFVFDGEIGEDEFYTEDSVPNPVNWYAQTKYEGEKLVQNSSGEWMIVRLAYPYRANFSKGDFFRAMKNRLSSNQPIAGVTDHIFCPTFIDDFAHALDVLIQHEATGIYHTVGAQPLSPYDVAREIADVFNLDKNLISKTTREKYFQGKAPRPFRLVLKNDKIKALGVKMKTFSEGLQEIKSQKSNVKS
jgi:dTDP-4-dehydrorhamnose reductase